MIGNLFRSREGRAFPDFLYELALDMFAVVQHWEPPAVSPGERGRLFESVLYRYCRARKLTLTETAGSRTVRRVTSASGFRHESDGVIATPEVTVHLELKHISEELAKNELLVFNQKGLDFLSSDNASFRAKPLFRVIVSGGPLKPEARRFAAQWGILAIEPDRLPLLVLHWLSGRAVPQLAGVDDETQQAIWQEVPNLVVPLQERVQRLSEVLGGGSEIISGHRIERAMTHQREAGDYYWMAVEVDDPMWLADQYDRLHRDLELDSIADIVRKPTAQLQHRDYQASAIGSRLCEVQQQI